MGRDFKKIKAWQYADRLAIEIYRATKYFPRDEIYGLTSQVRRASVSVAANIAEGSNRYHQREYRRFLDIAKGSLAEVEYLLYLSNKLGYLSNAGYQILNGFQLECAKTLFGLMKAVDRDGHSQ